MLKLFLQTVCVLFLVLVATPAFGFLGALDDLKQEFEAIESASDADLSDILNQLNEISGGDNFSDVHENDWFNTYVSSVARWDIASGYKDTEGNLTGLFGPGDQVTVAQILKMALRAAQVDETKCIGTAKLIQARTHWAHSFVVCAEQMNMRILGSPVDINRPALRGEVLSIVHDAFGDSVPPLFSSFNDTADHPLESDIAYAAALGIVSGDKDSQGNPTGTFRPNAPVNRAEAAKIIYEKLRVFVTGEQ